MTTFSMSKGSIPSPIKTPIFHCESWTYGWFYDFLRSPEKPNHLTLFLTHIFYKRHRNLLSYGFHSVLIPQKQKLQENPHYYKKPPSNQVSIPQLYGFTHVAEALYCGGLWQLPEDVTILQHRPSLNILVHCNKRSYTMHSWVQLLKTL